MSDGLRENHGILQVLARKHVALNIAQDDAVRGIDNNPAAVDQHFRDNVLGVVLGCQQQQATGVEAGTARKIQKRIGGGAANGQQLAVVQRDFGIADGKFTGSSGQRTMRPGAYPGQDGLNFFFGRRFGGDHRVGEALQVTAHGVFPGNRITEEQH